MRLANTERTWGWGARALHWIMAGLILFQLGLGLRMTEFTADLVTRFDLTQTHKSWGSVIFVLALLRLGWRLANRASPGLPAGTPFWQVRAARISHAALYVLILALPLSGWIAAAASPTQDLLGIENMVFGTFALPDPWVPGVKSVADSAALAHRAAAMLLVALLAVHIAAALKHHFFDRDDVLARMTYGR
jgi:cytochrome b561